VRRYIFIFLLCVIFFILPLQIFIISHDTGIGIQGAVYRYQITEYGISFIPLLREINFVLNGTLTGKTALSVILWVSGTTLLTCLLIYSIISVDDTMVDYYKQISFGLVVSCCIYLGSCIIQYGFFFNGPAGISLPFGIIVILFWIIILYKYSDFIWQGKGQ
jgi:hypothetical protein